MSGTVEIPPWGECVVKDCHVVGVRCYWGKCPACCDKKDRDSTGTMLHAPRTKTEEFRVQPNYKPRPPKLVAVTSLKESTA